MLSRITGLRLRCGIPWLAGSLVLLSATSVASQITDFGGYRPHFQGAAAATAGGRGGIVNRVTNTNDVGPGSFREAVATRPGCVNTAATCARIVVFETSGRIQLDSGPIFINSPFLTIAGQTAPAPGITISHRPIWVQNTHDIVIQHIRIRLGDRYYPGHNGNHITNGTQSAALYLVDDSACCSNNKIVIDHVSISWATATAVTVSADSVAMLDSIVSEGLNAGSTETGAGILWLPGYQSEGLFARNLTAQVSHRQPWVAPGNWFSGYNNLAFNSQDSNIVYYGFQNFVANGYPTGTGWHSQADDVFKIVWMNNVALAGPQTVPATHAIKVDLSSAQAAAKYRIFLSGNTGPYMTLADQWAGVTFLTSEGAGGGKGSRADVEITNLATDAPFHLAYNYSMLPNAEVKAHVLANAGARPAERASVSTRDSADYRVVQGVSSGDGARIVSQNDVGGYPNVPVVPRPYVIPANAQGAGTCGSTSSGIARTVIECDLETMARALEPARAGTSSIAVPKRLTITR
jgi:hypothetical protein